MFVMSAIRNCFSLSHYFILSYYICCINSEIMRIYTTYILLFLYLPFNFISFYLFHLYLTFSHSLSFFISHFYLTQSFSLYLSFFYFLSLYHYLFYLFFLSRKREGQQKTFLICFKLKERESE